MERFTSYQNCYPENCLLADGEVIGFLDKDGRYYLIGTPSESHTIDNSTEWATHDHIDSVTYSLVRR